MKKINKILPIVVSTFLLFTPYNINAEEVELTPSQSPTPSASPTPEATPTSTPTPSAKPTASPTPTPTASTKPTPTPTPEETEEPIKYEIKLDQTKLELNTGKTATIKATVTPSDKDVKIKWSSSNKEAVTVDENGKITTGKVAAKDVIITAQIEGTDVKATCTVDVSRVVGKDATLKDLNIENGKLDQSFDPKTEKYKVTVNSTVNSLEFTSLKKDLNDSNAKYFVTGNEKLKDGDTVEIKVIAEDGETTKIYELTIVKDTVNLNLKSLKINGYALNEVFETKTLEYTASIPYEIEIVTIQAVAESKNAKVEVAGNTNLKVGENTVKITVSDDSNNTKTYKIIVTREKEVSVEEKPTSIITSSNINNNTPTTSTSTNTNIPKDNGHCIE